MNGLSFKTLELANVQRIPTFKNRLGEPAHSTNDGSDWTLSDWVLATVGELGELANVLKKIKRGDYNDRPGDAAQDAADEIADVQIYLSILAYRMRAELGIPEYEECIVHKFNVVSERVNSPIRLCDDSNHWEVVS